jgi:hypothetical protein
VTYRVQGHLMLFVTVTRVDGAEILRVIGPAPDAVAALLATLDRWDFNEDGIPYIVLRPA